VKVVYVDLREPSQRHAYILAEGFHRLTDSERDALRSMDVLSVHGQVVRGDDGRKRLRLMFYDR
jgi:hypothetical protein